VNAVLTAKGLSAGHADRVIFSGVDLVVSPGKVIGLVGANGAGKSTLLRMLAGLDDGAREAGSVSLNPATATVGYLPQEPERRAGESVLDVHRAADRGRRRCRRTRRGDGRA
jgi:ATPase subunit of ABC transporter with duplicated ATPase domains